MTIAKTKMKGTRKKKKGRGGEGREEKMRACEQLGVRFFRFLHYRTQTETTVVFTFLRLIAVGLGRSPPGLTSRPPTPTRPPIPLIRSGLPPSRTLALMPGHNFWEPRGIDAADMASTLERIVRAGYSVTVLGSAADFDAGSGVRMMDPAAARDRGRAGRWARWM